METLQAKLAREAEAVADRTAMTEVTEAEMTYAGNITTSTSAQTVKSAPGAKKKVAKPKLSAKEKKERSVHLFFLFCFSPSLNSIFVA